MKTKNIHLCVAMMAAILLSACSLDDFQTSYKSYAIAVSANDGGSVTGGNPSIAYNSDITVTATPSVGYAFTGWYEGTVKASSAGAYTFTVKSDRNLVAHFKDIRIYTITINQVGANFKDVLNRGIVTGAGNHLNNTTAHLVATPATGYHFGGWYATRNDFNSLASSDSIYAIACTQDTTLYAMFIANKYNVSLTANPAVGGTPSGAGSYDYNTVATLSAVANIGYRFNGFYDEAGTLLSSTTPFDLTVKQDKQIEARFVKIWTVHVSNDGNGTASINGKGTMLVVDDGASVTLNATPNTNYYFAGWYDGNVAVSPSNSYTITVTGNVNLEATFTTDPKSTGTIIDWTNNPMGGGTAN